MPILAQRTQNDLNLTDKVLTQGVKMCKPLKNTVTFSLRFSSCIPIWAAKVASNSDKSTKSIPTNRNQKSIWSKSFLNHLPDAGWSYSITWASQPMLMFAVADNVLQTFPPPVRSAWESLGWSIFGSHKNEAELACRSEPKSGSLGEVSYPNQQLQFPECHFSDLRSLSAGTSLAISGWPLPPPNMPSQRGDNWGGQEAFHMRVRDSHRPWHNGPRWWKCERMSRCPEVNGSMVGKWVISPAYKWWYIRVRLWPTY